MRKRQKHWKKEEAVRNETKILKLLKNTEMRFGELQQMLSDLSPTTLTKHLKALLRRKTIARYWNEDKKANYYQIKPESKDKVTGSLGKYEAIKFVKNIQNPMYVYEEKGKMKVAAFSTVPSTVNRKEYEKKQKAILSKNALRLLNAFVKRPPSGEKMALVIMIERNNT